MAKPVRLNLGCGGHYWPGFINVDLAHGDIQADLTTWEPQKNWADEIHAIHIFEHFDHERVPLILARWRAALKPRGKLVLELPSLTKIVKLMSEGMVEIAMKGIYGEVSIPGMSHKWCWSEEELSTLLDNCGFSDIEEKPAKFHYKIRDMRIEAHRRD